MYNLYVIELDREVLQSTRFREANPDRREDKFYVYVGSMWLTPEERFGQHKEGYKSNSFVQHSGPRLKPKLYRNFQGYQTREQVEDEERRMAAKLWKKGYPVWQR
jgi:hypothetical protein